MLNYDLKNGNRRSIYENLYECLKNDIVAGRLAAGDRLLSKREMAKNYGISVKTVVHAYEQLVEEEYIKAKGKRGYYVAKIYEHTGKITWKIAERTSGKEIGIIDFSSDHLQYQKFLFSVWKKVMREVLTEYENELIERTDWKGEPILREAIAKYLERTRGIEVAPEQIIVGTGVESLYNRLFRIFPEESVYAAETPGYRKIPWLYEDARLSWCSEKMDTEGICVEKLRKSNANIVHVSPEHQYPLGIAMSEKRKQELLEWAGETPDRYIIEDDYDCEFQYGTQMNRTLKSMDTHPRGIYMNTFGKTMAPAIWINYMILPPKILGECQKSTGRFPSPVPSCEQYTMAKFIEEGYYERHVRKMKKYCEETGRDFIMRIKKTEEIPLKALKGGKTGHIYCWN